MSKLIGTIVKDGVPQLSVYASALGVELVPALDVVYILPVEMALHFAEMVAIACRESTEMACAVEQAENPVGRVSH